jgi:hypothetical protein
VFKKFILCMNFTIQFPRANNFARGNSKINESTNKQHLNVDRYYNLYLLMLDAGKFLSEITW